MMKAISATCCLARGAFADAAAHYACQTLKADQAFAGDQL
jgi:hypothetical protein